MPEPDTDVLASTIRAAIAEDAAATTAPTVASVFARGRRRSRARAAVGVVAAVALTGGAVLAGGALAGPAVDRREGLPATGLVSEPSEVVLDRGVGADGPWRVVASREDGACLQYIETDRTGGACQLSDPVRLSETLLTPVQDNGEPYTVVAGPAPFGSTQVAVDSTDGRRAQARLDTLAGRTFFSVRVLGGVSVQSVVATDAQGAVLAAFDQFLPAEALVPPTPPSMAPPPLPPQEARRLVDQFRAFAAEPSPEALADLPLANEVSLGLGDELVATVQGEELARPEAWALPVELYAGGIGPFSALDELQDPRPFHISAGPHPHCASPPRPGPAPFAVAERISIQPDAPECLAWYSVDFFLVNGLVAAITLDYWEP